ncbi:MAG: thiamine phosphate synthase [Muribaculaceae bacterium]|nr:thiamine phosphate synthase [Muribaculaceae bacterium]
MIQILISMSEKYSLAEMSQMAIEGGCGWIVLHLTEESDVASLAEDLVPLCRDAGVILTIAGPLADVRRLEAHGVYLKPGDNAIAVREELGPEAIVGITVSSASAAVTLAQADIDYVTLPAGTADKDAAAIIADARAAGAEIPFVLPCAAPDFEGDFAARAKAVGYAGFFITDGLFDCDDPVARIEAVHQLVLR